MRILPPPHIPDCQPPTTPPPSSLTPPSPPPVLTAKLNLGLVAVWGSLLAFHVVQLAGVIYHYLFLGPLAAGREPMDQPPPAVQCTMVPEPRGGVEVCVPASS